MKEDFLIDIFSRRKNICSIGGFLFLPAKVSIDIFRATDCKVSSNLHSSCDLIILLDEPLTFYRNWRTSVFEICKIAEDSVTFIIKVADTRFGSSDDVFCEFQKYFTSLTNVLQYKDKKTSFDVLVFECQNKTNFSSHLKEKSGRISLLEKLLLKIIPFNARRNKVRDVSSQFCNAFNKS